MFNLRLKLGKLLKHYYFSGNHPSKLRIFYSIVKLLKLLQIRLLFPYINNSCISLDLSEYVDFTIFKNGEYEREVFSSLMRHSVANEILWDIGGHIGSFSLKVLNRFEIDEVHCFEPSPKNFRILSNNKAENGNPQKWNIHNFGIGDKVTKISFFQGLGNNAGGSKFIENSNDSVLPKLSVDTIDNLVYTCSFKPPTLMKIDVEGFEQFVFEGAKRLFELLPPKAIVFEAEATGTTLKNKEIEKFLLKHNYKIECVFAEDEVGGPFQNFLATQNNS